MSAVLDGGTHIAEPQCADMFGHPVQAPGQDDTPLHSGFMGVVRDPPLVFDGPRGEVRLQLVLDQALAHHPQAMPVLVDWHLPDQGDYVATRARAAALAATLPAGTQAIARGAGLECGHHHRQPVFRLLHVMGVIPAPAEA